MSVRKTSDNDRAVGIFEYDKYDLLATAYSDVPTRSIAFKQSGDAAINSISGSPDCSKSH
eukprot:scaffold93336_cov22-Prasinocladus_malaysianus.AAC.1